MATTTYEPIQSQTLGSATNTVTFNSFSGYTDLRLVVTAKTSDSSGYFNIYPNNNTGSNYSFTYMTGNGSTATSNRNSNSSLGLQVNCSTSSQDVNAYPLFFDFMSYANTTTAKTILARSGGTSVGLVEAGVWLYRSPSNAAITSLVIKANTTTFAIGSTFTLYGIANAQIEAPKATGGTITYDDTYFYHTFGSSGTFTPQQSLTADILVVAGGGAGGTRVGGGGGAGGLCYRTGGSLTATPYTITVGAGGAGVSVFTDPSNVGGNSSIAGSGFTTITANGGGYGRTFGGSASNGGSGGGGGLGTSYTAGGTSTQTGSGGSTGYGNAGGNGVANGSGSGGGGGAGAVGADGVLTGGGGGGSGGNSNSGAGGAGLSSSTLPVLANFGSTTGTGVNVSGTYYYAGGGGGGGRSDATTSVPGAGGLGGGAAGATSTNTGGNGLTNTGGGGGGAWDGTTGSGGSGIVIIRYLKA
jgi:hypothetical protein